MCNSGGGSFDNYNYYRPVTYNGTHTSSTVEILLEPLIGSAPPDEAFAVIIKFYLLFLYNIFIAL